MQNDYAIRHEKRSDQSAIETFIDQMSRLVWYTVVSNTYTDNGKKLFIREFPIESIGQCIRAGICYNYCEKFS